MAILYVRIVTLSTPIHLKLKMINNMKLFKLSELKKTSAEYWMLDSIKCNVISSYNPIKYMDYLIQQNDSCGGKYSFVHDGYDGAPDANDHRYGFGSSIEDCIQQINQYILENEVED